VLQFHKLKKVLPIYLKELCRCLNGLAPPAERFQSLYDLVTFGAECAMNDDVRLSLLVFFNLYLGLLFFSSQWVTLCVACIVKLVGVLLITLASIYVFTKHGMVV
jgi:hypothetical protein